MVIAVDFVGRDHLRGAENPDQRLLAGGGNLAAPTRWTEKAMQFQHHAQTVQPAEKVTPVVARQRQDVGPRRDVRHLMRREPHQCAGQVGMRGDLAPERRVALLADHPVTADPAPVYQRPSPAGVDHHTGTPVP